MSMRLRVTWDQGHSATVRAEKSWPLEELKRAIAACTGLPPEEQRLYLEDRRAGQVELTEEAKPLASIRGYAADLTLVRCHPRQLQWLQLVALDWQVLDLVPKALKADEEMVRAALEQCGCALQFASPALRANRQLVHLAVQRDPEALEFAAEVLRADQELVLAAMEQDAMAFRFADEALRANRDLALMAVERNGELLEFVAGGLQADRELVLAAVQENGSALRFAVEDLRGDRDVVLAAVRENPYALEFVAYGFVPDREIMQAALGDDKVNQAAPEKKALPAEYRWMGFQAPPEPQPEPPAIADQDHAEDALDQQRRLELAVHWRLEVAGLVHRWEPGLRLQPPPCCADCRLGRHLWCPRCGPAAMAEADEAMRDVAARDPKRVKAEEKKVRVFLGAGLGWTAADLQASAFKGVPP